MSTMPFHHRLAELYTIQTRRRLTDTELADLDDCLSANARYCWEAAALQNLSYAAYVGDDMNWLHEICARIDDLEERSINRKADPKSPPSA